MVSLLFKEWAYVEILHMKEVRVKREVCAHAVTTYGAGGITPHILKLGILWKKS